jgi:hypothetical protein
MRVALALLIVALLTACENPFGPDDGGVVFAVEAESYTPGDVIRGELRNTSLEGIAQNLCFSTYERKHLFSWREATGLYELSCVTKTFPLEAGGVAQFTSRVPANLAEGTYRLRTTIELSDGGREPRTTASFSIR